MPARTQAPAVGAQGRSGAAEAYVPLPAALVVANMTFLSPEDASAVRRGRPCELAGTYMRVRVRVRCMSAACALARACRRRLRLGK